MEVFETVQLLLALGCAALVVVVRGLLRSLPGCRLVLAAFGLFLTGALLSVIEGLVHVPALALIEHLCHAGSSLLLVLWMLPRRRGRPPG